MSARTDVVRTLQCIVVDVNGVCHVGVSLFECFTLVQGTQMTLIKIMSLFRMFLVVSILFLFKLLGGKMERAIGGTLEILLKLFHGGVGEGVGEEEEEEEHLR